MPNPYPPSRSRLVWCCRLFAAALLTIVAIRVPPAAAQDKPEASTTARDGASARVGGRVFDAVSGAPLTDAQVKADCEAFRGQMVSVRTDAAGRWHIAVPPGRCRFIVTKDGYVLGWYLPPQAAGVVVLKLSEGQIVDHDVRLKRAGTISGQIRSDGGEPLSGVRMQAMAYRYITWQRRLVPVGSAESDTEGRFRMSDLPPGEYLVSASMPGTATADGSGHVAYVPTFFPGTPLSSGATPIEVRAGEEPRDLSFRIISGRLATVSGRALTAAGTPVPLGLVVMASTTSSMGLFGHTATVERDGQYRFSNVPPGQYRLQAQYTPQLGNGTSAGGPRDMEVREAGSIRLAVESDDLNDVTIVTAPTAIVSGRVVFEGGKAPAGLDLLSVRGYTMSAEAMTAGGIGLVHDDLTFVVTGLSERQRLRPSGLPPGWFLKSVMFQGSDVTDVGLDLSPGQRVTGIDIVLTRRPSELSGVVSVDTGAVATDASVVVFSKNPDKWGYQSRFVQTVNTDLRGRFTVRGLPPDEYLALAVDEFETGAERDPEQLERWRSRATAVRVAADEPASVTLRVVRAPNP